MRFAGRSAKGPQPPAPGVCTLTTSPSFNSISSLSLARGEDLRLAGGCSGDDEPAACTGLASEETPGGTSAAGLRGSRTLRYWRPLGCPCECQARPDTCPGLRSPVSARSCRQLAGTHSQAPRPEGSMCWSRAPVLRPCRPGPAARPHRRPGSRCTRSHDLALDLAPQTSMRSRPR